MRAINKLQADFLIAPDWLFHRSDLVLHQVRSKPATSSKSSNEFYKKKRDLGPKTRLGLNDVMLAAFFLDTKATLELLRRGRDFRFKTENGLSVMHFAALNIRYGVELVSIYFFCGLDPVEPDCDGATPIDYALFCGFYQTAEWLLLITNPGINLLHYCVMRNQLEMAERVAEMKPELLKKCSPDGRNTLHLAALHSDWAMCNWITEMMQSLNQRLLYSECQMRGCTALHYAGLNKTHGVELVCLFANWEMDVNKRSLKGYTPVHFALIAENLETAKEMIRLGADYNAKMFDKNPMKVLLAWERFESVKFLHSCDKDLIHHARVKGLHPIHFAARYADLDFVQWLVEVAGISVHRLSLKRMSSPLHYAGSNLRHGAEIANYLIDSGVEVNRKNQIGETPLHCALRHENVDVAKLLIDKGADLSEKLNGENYLHFCLSNGAEICAKLVYDCRKGLINDVLSNGTTVLHIAAEKATLPTARWLIEAGANIDAQTNDGKKPAFFAKDETMRLYFQELLIQQDIICVAFLTTPSVQSPSRVHLAEVMAALNGIFGPELVAMFSLLGLEPNDPGSNGVTPIDCALDAGQLGTAEKLLKLHNAGCNLMHYCVVRNDLCHALDVLRSDYKLATAWSFDGRNALHLAAQYASENLCQRLIEEMKREGQQNYVGTLCSNRGGSSLHYAGLNVHHGEKVTSILIGYGLDLNLKDKRGYTPFAYALMAENFVVAEEMLKFQVDWRKNKIRGQNLMTVCILMKKYESVKFLHNLDEKMIHRIRISGMNALHHAVREADLETCRWLVENAGISAKKVCKRESSCLHYVGSNKSHGADIARYLLGLGLSVDHKNNDGMTPLSDALVAKNTEVVKVMLEHGADLKVRCKGDNYLHLCLRLGAFDCAKLVYEKKRRLIRERTLDYGKSVLHIAAENASVETVHWLLREGADFYAKTTKGEHAWSFIKNDNKEMHECFNALIDAKLGMAFKMNYEHLDKLLDASLHICAHI
ncbi:Hypothetical predicted protein [Cloeon dipterum]|uniref:Uncharacterized protein n=1 Tax=Cloeon dipterum TaxID=197152 RepID=A0A8S1DVD4_9INSE|nr:Hypothetical predicted protein [Cloeon dipterum]